VRKGCELDCAKVVLRGSSLSFIDPRGVEGPIAGGVIGQQGNNGR
jgi:hypothetical protein